MSRVFPPSEDDSSPVDLCSGQTGLALAAGCLRRLSRLPDGVLWLQAFIMEGDEYNLRFARRSSGTCKGYAVTVAGVPTVAELMSGALISVPGSEPVEAAIEVISRHDLKSLPVVEGGRVIGVVTPAHLLGQPLDRPVSEVVAPVVPATPGLSPAEAWDRLTRQRVEILPVTQDGRLVGEISLTAILRAIGTDTDPLTGLPWSVALRTWVGTALKQGYEVAVILCDLDDFGLINKSLGYVAGDALVRAVASLLRGLVDGSTDLLCRHGGDEFAIATIRKDAKALAHRIREAVSLSLQLKGTRYRLTASVGLARGRCIDRPTPFPLTATVEDLLALAHRSAKEAWVSRRGIAFAGEAADEAGHRTPPPPQSPAHARLRLVRVTTYGEPSGSAASIELGLGRRSAVGTASAHFRGKGLSFLVAEATLRAILQLLGQEQAFVLEDLIEVTHGEGRVVVVVLANIRASPERFVGGACGPDPAHTVAQAILDALNRRLSRVAAEVLRRDSSPGSERPH